MKSSTKELQTTDRLLAASGTFKCKKLEYKFQDSIPSSIPSSNYNYLCIFERTSQFSNTSAIFEKSTI